MEKRSGSPRNDLAFLTLQYRLILCHSLYCCLSKKRRKDKRDALALKLDNNNQTNSDLVTCLKLFSEGSEG